MNGELSLPWISDAYFVSCCTATRPMRITKLHISINMLAYIEQQQLNNSIEKQAKSFF